MDDTPTPTRGPARYADGRFGPGNPGRPLGSRNRVAKRIALGLLHHYAAHEDDILERLERFHFPDYVRLISRLLPRAADDGDGPDLESMPHEDAVRVARAARRAANRVETGEGTLADVEAALAGVGIEGEAP